ncbi:EF-Tu/IF-2/RF-3 family GTPase [Streptomyces sp. UNOB3_S3]|uniref:EF-Tu C-terminal domain-related protein n=1 Tax=Streptomyces sp. UNOB3_S3 TaxID=2871682 RepID=UPI001E4B587F|nr:EF-Tu/IF-2/RF-3 family GTPase [Streptomyces sp. UNOB3_S3]
MNAADEPFLMCVEDVFCRNQGRVVLLTGRIERGRVRKGDEVEIVGFGGGAIVPVEGIEGVCGRPVGEASAGMNVGLLLPGVAAGPADTTERGQVIAAPGSVTAHAGFEADIALLSEEQGSVAVSTGERLQFHFRAAVVPGVVSLTQATDILHPLHGGMVEVALERPVAIEEGQPFVFRHHGRAAGSGTVTRLLR